jgi:hypothetical protein
MAASEGVIVRTAIATAQEVAGKNRVGSGITRMVFLCRTHFFTRHALDS